MANPVPGRALRLAGARVSMRVERRPIVVGLVLAVLVVGVSVVSIGTGDYPIAVTEVIRTLVGHGSASTTFIVETLRLPRVLTAIEVGLALGLAGAMFQSLLRNPLGSPDIIGFTTGAATGALVEILVIGGSAAMVAAGSTLGGLLTAAALYLLALKGGASGYRLILVGIGVTALLDAVNAYLFTKADLHEAMLAAVWLVGSLDGRGWEYVRPLTVGLVILVPAALVVGRDLRLLEIGDDGARQLGVSVERARISVIVVAVALTAVATAAAGPVAFVALAAPQLARRLTRATGPGLVNAALMGALVMVASDLAAQRVFAPTQLPVGVMTGVLGGVYLVWLLAVSWRRSSS